MAAFKLLGLASDEPMVLFYYYLPAEMGRQAIALLQDYEKKNEWFSFTRYYREEMQINLGSARQTFEAVTEPQQALQMKLSAESALFKVTSIIYTRSEKPVELRHAYYRGDRYKFNISREIS